MSNYSTLNLESFRIFWSLDSGWRELHFYFFPSNFFNFFFIIMITVVSLTLVFKVFSIYDYVYVLCNVDHPNDLRTQSHNLHVIHSPLLICRKNIVLLATTIATIITSNNIFLAILYSSEVFVNVTLMNGKSLYLLRKVYSQSFRN